MSELRSGVHALRNRFELARRDMAADFQEMAAELHAAGEAFRRRPGHPMEASLRRAARPAERPAHPSPPPTLDHGPQTEADAEAAPDSEAPAYEPATLTTPDHPLHAAHAAPAPEEHPADEHPAEATPRHTHRERPELSKKRRR
jgi:hypothetical protein